NEAIPPAVTSAAGNKPGPVRRATTEKTKMMTYNEARNATLEQLTDELAAAGYESTQTERSVAFAAVVALIAEIAPNSLPAAYHTGYAAGEAGDDECEFPAGSYDADAWQMGYDAATR